MAQDSGMCRNILCIDIKFKYTFWKKIAAKKSLKAMQKQFYCRD